MFISKCVGSSLKIRDYLQVVRKLNSLKRSPLSLEYSSLRHFAMQTETAVDGGNDQMPVLSIANGMIRGLKRKTIYDDDYYGFEGIPYAQPPLGELRFKSPRAASNWDGIRECTDTELKPLQKNFEGEIEGTEDCLYLNVYTKTLNPQKNLPVLVWIYGGAFNTGSCMRSKYSPDYFMQEDVILVSFNYRLSTFGFLSFADPTLNIPGNAGLKDQILALKWVRDNISRFGGNRDNVTLFGESAGAASVHYMMCTDKTKGLFHKAICMSGCVLNNWAFTEKGTELPYRLACEHGYTGPNDDCFVLKYLQELSPDKLLHMDKHNTESRVSGVFFSFLPSREPYDSEDAVVRKPLLEIMKNSWANEIPLIIGGTSFEGLVRYPLIKQRPSIIKLSQKVPEMTLPLEVLVGKSDDDKKLMLEKIVKLHYKEPGDSQKEIMDSLHYFTFRAFWHPFHRLVKSRQLHAAAPTYQYLFDFDSPTFNHHRKMFCGTDIQKGVAHADDLAYIFYSHYSWKLGSHSMEYLTLRRMITMWTQFAKTANPNCEYTQESTWKTIGESNIEQWLRIANDLSFEEMSDDFKIILDTWNSLYGEKLL